jgi:quinol monooxygenase YgiN
MVLLDPIRGFAEWADCAHVAEGLEGEALLIIVAGYSFTAAGKRDAAVAAFAGMVERARKHDGCLDLSISADSVDPDRINSFECWRDEQSWKAWRKIAKGPRVKLRETVVKMYRTDKAEKLS